MSPFIARTIACRRAASVTLATLLAACGGGDAPTTPGTPPPPPPAVVTTVTVAPDSTTLRVAETMTLTATVKDAAGAAMPGQPLTWASSAAAVASVSATGVVTGVGPGRAEVTATAGAVVGRAVVWVRLPYDTLAAAATELAGAVIPDRRPPEDTTSYRRDHPVAVGVPVSVSGLKVLLRPSATVGEVNALLKDLKAEIAGGMPGGGRGGLLILRLPTTTHAGLDSALTRVRAQGFVRVAAADVQLSEGAVTGANGGTPPNWTWLTTPGGGNYGLELMRVPQLWNLNTVVRRRGAAGVTELGIYDTGFGAHDDLVVAVNRSPGVASNHGLHVAGTAAATFNNGRGIDGVTPFASLVLEASPPGTSTWLHALRDLLVARPALRVVNVSLAYNWRANNNGLDTDVTPWAQQHASADGAVLDWLLQGAAATRGPHALPVIVVAAGNDSRPGVQQAKWASPFTAAALLHGNQAIIVVENVDATQARWISSNVNGHVSAPGTNILSLVNATAAPATCTTATNCYDLKTGTSMAAPHVTGLVAYLYSLSPTLPPATPTANPVRELLLANTRTATNGASAMVDAFFAALDLDRLEGSDRILRGLLDIDDGSVDGNLRVSAQGATETSEDLDGDGHPGDGGIDMADFRRFRDAVLQVEAPAGLALDGGATHPKRDLNQDGVVGPLGENVYPRADFNGDGLIDRTATRLMRGALGGQVVTDLAVLQSRFSDPHYQASQLPGLLDSGDIAVLLQQCAGLQGVVSLRLQARVQNTNPVVQQRTVPATDVHQVFTLPVHASGYLITVEGLDATGTVQVSAEGTLPAHPGGDATFGPVCRELRITTTPAVLQQFAPNVATPVTILVEHRDPAGAWVRSAGATLSVSMVRGSVSSTTGTTDAQGEAVVGVTWDGTAAGQLRIKARLADGATREVQLGVGTTPLSLPGGSLPAGRVGEPYTGGVQATGGTPPYIYSGNPPAGLVLNATTGAITGTPTTNGIFPFTVQVTAGGQVASATYQIIINGAIVRDPWSGGYEGPGGPADVALVITSHNNGIYPAALALLIPGTRTSYWSSNFCSLSGTPASTTMQGSCLSSPGITVTRSTQVINGVTKRVLTGTLTNARINPNDLNQRGTINFTAVEK